MEKQKDVDGYEEAVCLWLHGFNFLSIAPRVWLIAEGICAVSSDDRLGGRFAARCDRLACSTTVEGRVY